MESNGFHQQKTKNNPNIPGKCVAWGYLSKNDLQDPKTERIQFSKYNYMVNSVYHDMNS